MRRPISRRRFIRRDDAEVGVGTLIVFIAMVLVAAVAAAVIIGTSGTLQQRAVSTGKEATTEVTSNLKVVGLEGERNSTSEGIYVVTLHLQLSAGAQDIDLDDVLMRYGDGETVRNYATAGAYTFTLEWIRGNGGDNVMEAGDLVELTFTIVDEELPPRSDFEILLVPGTGAEVYVAARTPSTYGDDTLFRIQ